MWRNIRRIHAAEAGGGLDDGPSAEAKLVQVGGERRGARAIVGGVNAPGHISHKTARPDKLVIQILASVFEFGALHDGGGEALLVGLHLIRDEAVRLLLGHLGREGSERGAAAKRYGNRRLGLWILGVRQSREYGHRLIGVAYALQVAQAFADRREALVAVDFFDFLVLHRVVGPLIIAPAGIRGWVESAHS